MGSYDNYNPELPIADETPVIAPPVTEGRKRKDQGAKRRKVSAPKDKEPEKKPDDKPKSDSFTKRIANFFKSQSAKILFGIFLGCLTVYLGVAFISYFSTCIQDQSQIATTAVGYAGKVANPGGEGGARLSEFLINEGFGVGALVIVIWIGALSLKLLVGRPKFKTLDFTIKCIVALITLSLIVGLLTYTFHSTINWGGYHGTYVNEFIINFIGPMGAVLLSIFMIATFVAICLRDLVNWIIRVRNKQREKRRIERELREQERQRQEELAAALEQERIDDLKAGESADLKVNDDIIDAPVDETLEFPDEETRIYDLDTTVMEASSQAEDSVLTEGISNESDTEDLDGLSEASSEYVTDTENIQDDDAANNQGSDETSESEDEESPEAKKMQVNVNQIAASSEKHYKSEVEMYEDQHYKFPPYALLREGSQRIDIDPEEQIENKKRIETTLLEYGIPITSIEATVGPTVTLYEIVPDKSVMVGKIRKLADDIALRIRASSVRIIAPIPGKGTVGIEVPNEKRQMVSMRTVIQSKKYQESRYHLPVALGCTISNEVYIADLAKMPHLLVAGATGQGKSVGLNTIIASLLYCKAPYELKFVMIDPKQVEFSFYNKLKDYYMAMIPGDGDEPVITDMDKVQATLNSLCVEMDQRYNLLKTAQTRNIEEYNAKIREGKLNPAEGHRFLPYIVVVVDEFGDLMMVAGKAVEMPIARLAQKARAVGMHVIIATQRPSTNVITGIIKANFPARMSFRVFSGVDSKTILDATGANQLIGMGDMLILNNSETVRVQCAFIDTPEVNEICDYISRQPYPQGPYILPEPPIEGADEAGSDSGLTGPRDPLFEEVARSVVNSGSGSTSMIQRHYSIGYNRAGKIMDQLERAKIVGPSSGGKPRAVLVDPISLEDILANL